jgi:AcrR family transcriptional regulator
MLAKGFAAATVDEICAAAGASKGSFYHFFDSKESLGLATLDAVFTRMVERLRNGPHTDIEDPVEQAFAFLDHVDRVAHELWGDGCLVGSFALDVGESNPAIRAEVSRLFSDLKRGLAEWFQPLCTGRGGSDGRCGAVRGRARRAFRRDSARLDRACEGARRLGLCGPSASTLPALRVGAGRIRLIFLGFSWTD